MAYFLFLDTSSSLCYVALFEGETPILASVIESTMQTKNLLPEIHSLLKRADIPLNSLDAFATAVGPGSFTGTRIGVVTAKTLSFTLRKSLMAIDSLTPYEIPGTDRGVALLTKKEHVYLKERESLPTYHPLSFLSSYTRGLASPDSETLVKRFPQLDVIQSDYQLERVGSVLMNRWNGSLFEDPHRLNALYLAPLC